MGCSKGWPFFIVPVFHGMPKSYRMSPNGNDPNNLIHKKVGASLPRNRHQINLNHIQQ